MHDIGCILNFVLMKCQGPLRFVWLTALAVWCGQIAGQLDVTMQCVQVNTAGNTTVSWDAPADPSGLFYQYVFHQFPAANPANISTTNMPDINQNSVIAPGVNGNEGPVCYFVVTQSTNGSSTISDTICNPFLIAQPSFSPGFADLTWNSPRIATGAIGADFVVQKSDNMGGWIDLETVPDNGGMLSTTYEVEECSETLEFRVIQPNPAAGCSHESNRSGSQINDELDPDAPAITDIDVNHNTGLALVHWDPSTASDLAGYILYLCSGGSQVPIDTIYNPNATFYVNAQSNAGSVMESYNIAAFDSCFVNGEPDPGAANPGCASSLWMTASRQPCSDAAVVSWAGPYGTAGDILSYSIHAQEAENADLLVWGDPVVLGTTEAGVYEFAHVNATLGNVYRYWVEAHHSTGNTSISNRKELDFLYPGAPAYTNILRATAMDSAGVEVIVDFDDTMTEAHHFILERKRTSDPSAPFLRIDAATAVGGVAVDFQDLGAHSSVMSYTYRIRVENLCNDSVGMSNEATTMFLDGATDEEQLVNTLFWNAYSEFPGTVTSYRIFRSENGGGPVPLVTLPATITTYEDELDQTAATSGEFCYLIEATDSQPGPNGGVNYALSNTTCLTVPPVIWIPNAITVEGFNPIFKPIISYADLETFRMEIYSRWGDVIYFTDNAELGWDGTVEGQVVQEGAYGYTMWVQDGAGKQYTRSGLVHVLVEQ